MLYCTIKQSIALEFDYMLSIAGNISSSWKHLQFKIEISVPTPSLLERLQNFALSQNRYLAHCRTSSFSSNSNYFLCHHFGLQSRLVLVSRKKLTFLKGKVIDFLAIGSKTYHLSKTGLRKVPTLKREISDRTPGYHMDAKSGEAGLGSCWEASPWPGTDYDRA